MPIETGLLGVAEQGMGIEVISLPCGRC